MFCQLNLRILATLACVLLGIGLAGADESVAPADRYVLTYPEVQQFSPPVETYFDDVTQTIQKVGGRTIRHKPNGGYGLPVAIKVGDKNLLHLGADVAWHGVGKPVYTIADGVVRISEGPLPVEKQSGEKNPPDAKTPMSWGNVIVIEHRFADDAYVTSVYGHLSSNRLVAVGDVVQAGQTIGTIGKAGRENGGYKPHLHFGLREGRMFEPGCTLLTVREGGKPSPITVVELKEAEVELKGAASLPATINLQIGDRTFAITRREDKLWLPAAALNYVRRPDFPITGYGLSADGWRDPTEFLLAMLNKFPRAAFTTRSAASKRTETSEAAPLPKQGPIVKRPKIYNPRAKGEAQVTLAIKRATAGNKRVLIIYGGNWCGWCHTLHDLFNEDAEIRRCLKQKFEVVRVDLELKANQELATKYKAELKADGLPYLTMLNSAGEVLANQVASEFEDGKRYDSAKVLAFLEQ